VTASRARFIAGGAAAFAAVAQPHAARAAPPAEALVRRGEPGYDVARRLDNARHDRFPAAIAYCATPDDVAESVRWARAAGLPIAVRSGGHDYEAFSLNDGGAVIDVGGLRGVAIGAGRRTARIAAGTTVGEAYHRLADAGVTLPAGTCHSVGIAGLTTGGGFGFLGRRHGLLSDRLSRVVMIDANGARRDSERDAAGLDLLWAARGGGGGNFGIVTDFVFDVVPAPERVVLFALAWELRHAGDVLGRWMDWLARIPRELVTICLVQSAPTRAVRVIGQYLGSESAIAGALRASLPLAAATENTLETLPYIDAVDRYSGLGTPRLRSKMKSSYAASALDDAGIAAAAALVEAAPDGVRCILQFDSVGGAVNDVPASATAYPHRDMAYSLQYRTHWTDPADDARAFAWVRGAFAQLDPRTSMASYRNYCDLDLHDWQRRYHGPNYARLQRIKAALDGDGIFRFAQGIEPAASWSAPCRAS
jgi:FAD/FMN-containing dehydrogenase